MDTIVDGRAPTGERLNSGYNLRLIPKGCWLFLALANFKSTGSGVKGLRLFVNENSAGEKIMNAVQHEGGYNFMAWLADCPSDTNNARLGAFSNSACDISATLIAIRLY